MTTTRLPPPLPLPRCGGIVNDLRRSGEGIRSREGGRLCRPPSLENSNPPPRLGSWLGCAIQRRGGGKGGGQGASTRSARAPLPSPVRARILAGMTPSGNPSTWIEVDTGVLTSNIQALASHVGVRVMAVVKANGYGHGAGLVARVAARAGADWIGVARPEEGAELRRDGVGLPILVLGLTPPGQLAEAVAAGLALTVWSADHIEAAAVAAQDAGRPAKLHLKIDTGMGRLGAQPLEAVALARMASGRRGVALEGVCTHFARADEQDPAPTQMQERLFREVLGALSASGLNPGLIHAANSAAAIAHPSTRFDMVRAGVA